MSIGLNAKSGMEGSVLIEALIAILIFSFGILGVVGLQAVSIQSSIHAKYRSDAVFFTNQIMSQVMVDAANADDYADSSGADPSFKAIWLEQLSANLPNGSGTIEISNEKNSDGEEISCVKKIEIKVAWCLPSEFNADGKCLSSANEDVHKVKTSGRIVSQKACNSIVATLFVPVAS